MIKQIKYNIRKMFPISYDKIGKVKSSLILKKFKNDYPKTKIFQINNNTAIKHYSQENQDYIVYNHFFKDIINGVFCDIGGNHPLTMNNTRYFEELGWNGYVFEPLPALKGLWEKHRNAKLFPFALSDTEGEVVFTVVIDSDGLGDMFSSIKSSKDKNNGYDTEDIVVQTKCLKDVLYKEKVDHINYMSIDVEGHELNVLKGIDFKKLKVDVLTIENNPSCCLIYGDEKIRDLMKSNNYTLWGRIIGLDDIYVSNDFLNKKSQINYS